MGIFDSFYKKDVNASEPVTHPDKGPRYKVGDRIGKWYEIYRILGGEGKSGMGVVYVCYNHETKDILALKTFQEQFLSSKSMKDNFKKEALLWIHLERHPFIVRAKWVEKLDYRMFIACEFIAPDEQGRNTLTHYLQRPIPMKQSLTWSIQFCHGMEYAYSKGVTPHRDIKPDNIMITRDGIVKITDFGLAGLWDEAKGIREIKGLVNEDRKGFTFVKSIGDKVISGTPPWMAPEQFDGKADVRSDIYSFGIVMYQMANRDKGGLPFYPRTGDDWERAHKRYPVPKIDSRLYPLIKKCLRKKPEERYQTFDELRRDLRLLYMQETNEFPPSTPKKGESETWVFNNKGVSLTRLGLVDEAIVEYKKALRIDPEDEAVHINLGNALQTKGQIDEAIMEYREALRINPEYAEAHDNLGLVLDTKGQIDEAIMEHREALRINPEYAEAHVHLGEALRKKYLFDEAIMEYREALRINPEYAEAHFNLGDALNIKHLFDEAIMEYREALRINPEFTQAYFALAYELINKGLFDDAIKNYEDFIRYASPQHPSLENVKEYIRRLKSMK
jgi:serine/threonine protein kinase